MSDKAVAEAYVEYMKNRFPELNPNLIKVSDDGYLIGMDEHEKYVISLSYHGIHNPYMYNVFTKKNTYDYIHKIHYKYNMTIDKIKEILKELNIKYKIHELNYESYFNAYFEIDNNDGCMTALQIDTKTNEYKGHTCYLKDIKQHEYLMNVIKDLKQNINIILNMINEKSKLIKDGNNGK